MSKHIDPAAAADDRARLFHQGEKFADEAGDTAPTTEPVGPCASCGTSIFQNAARDRSCGICLSYDMADWR
jgi:hypothetical protein